MKINSLIPELSVVDIEKSKKFYIDILGFTLEYERAVDKSEFLVQDLNGYLLRFCSK